MMEIIEVTKRIMVAGNSTHVSSEDLAAQECLQATKHFS